MIIFADIFFRLLETDSSQGLLYLCQLCS